MHFSKEYKNETREIELDVNIYYDAWAVPFEIAWWKSSKWCNRAMLKRAFIFDFSVLCVHFSLTLWKWGE